jgi:lipoyl(octanoyl) transferase
MDRTVEQQLLLFQQEQSIEDCVRVLSSICTPVLAPNGAPIYRIERGGEVTYHGPGQLVCYPLLDLTAPHMQKDLHWYLRMMEQVVIETLAEFDIQGYRQPDVNTGVWVNQNQKIAAVGVSSSRWITTHGFALNVSPDLNYFDTSVIIPCGLQGYGVTSIAQVLEERGCCYREEDIPTVLQVAQISLDKLTQVFGITIQEQIQI